MKNASNIGLAICFSIILLFVIGEVKCIYKAFNCNWQPVGKAEIIYTVSSATGLGCIVGWLEIEDN